MSRVPGVGSTLLVFALLFSVALLAPTPVAGNTVQGTNGFEDGETELRIDLNTNGDARILIIERLPVTTEAEEAAFDDVATAFENEDYRLSTLAQFENASAAVDSRTDREMALSSYEWNATLVDSGDYLTGELTVAFTWENFARIDGPNDERLHVDDVLLTDQGPWLQGLTARQTLVIGFPDDHGVRNATVSPQGGELRWNGPATFDEQSLRATFIGDGQPEPRPDPSGGISDTTVAAALFVGFLLFIALALLFVRYRDRISLFIGTSGDDHPEPTQEAQAVEDDDSRAALSPEPATAPPHEDETAGDEPVIDEELLSDEERVERLLERNGGRMKQAAIVEATDWSNAKVSQLLSGMEEEGHIDKLRIGRENLISFPDVDLTDSDTEE